MLKRTIALCLALTCLLCFAACGAQTSSFPENGTTAASADTMTTASPQEHTAVSQADESDTTTASDLTDPTTLVEITHPVLPDLELTTFLDTVKDSVKRVYDVFPKLDDGTVIKDRYIIYDNGQYAAYVNCVFDSNEDYVAEFIRLRELGMTEEYVDGCVIDNGKTVPDAVKITYNYDNSVTAFMFDSGLLTYVLLYEEECRAVYVAVSENPLYTYSQFIPEKYLIIDDLKASATAG